MRFFPRLAVDLLARLAKANKAKMAFGNISYMRHIFFSLALLTQVFFLSDLSSTNAAEPEAQSAQTIDENIRVRVEPVVIGQLIDRVTEPATIFVDCTNIKTASVYMEPVDAPYGGKALAEPKLIGTSTDAKHGFPIAWKSVEPYPYVKLFAICAQNNKDGGTRRSHAIDIGLAGQRLKLQAVHEEKRHD